MTKQVLESNLTKVAGVAIEITFARTYMVTLFWEGKCEAAFEKLQRYFKGILYDYEYDEESDSSVCCLDIAPIEEDLDFKYEHCFTCGKCLFDLTKRTHYCKMGNRVIRNPHICYCKLWKK